MRESFYKQYLLAVLLVMLAFNQVEPAALSIALQNIKVDLNLTDTQLGLLSGIAFMAFYVLLGSPIARWADRGNRVRIIALTTALWCVAVALCGFAGSFVQLLLIRIGVAVGESGCIPCAHSLIADYFPRADRPRAVSRFVLGFPLGAAIGTFGAGWLNQLYGWRVTFLLVGLPGLALAVVARFTLKEPRLSDPSLEQNGPGTSVGQLSVKETCAALWANRTFRHLLIFFAVSCFCSFGIAQWQSVFFIRQYGLKTGELGSWIAMLWVSSLPATYLGGELASRFAANNERLQLRALTVLTVSSSIISMGVFLTANHYLAFGLIGISTFLGGLSGGPLFATLQTLVPPRMRAMSIAMIYLFANLFGIGLGPLAAGALSDAFRPWAGEESLRYALLTLCPGYFWACWHLWRAAGTVMHDIAKSRDDGHRLAPGHPLGATAL
jgi:MFS family permease